MRRLTPSGSRPTSTPPTMALPDVGSSRPQSIRMVVDLPAPLLPRNPKISPRATSNDTRSTATNWPKRRVRSRTWIAGPAADGSAAKGPVQTRLREAHVGNRPRAIELRLEARDLRVEHVGARRDPRLVALAD